MIRRCLYNGTCEIIGDDICCSDCNKSIDCEERCIANPEYCEDACCEESEETGVEK